METQVFRIGDTQVRILVPSRRKDGGVVDRELRAEWESKARSLLEQCYGGATPSYVHGSYQDDGRTTREEVTVLTAACSRQSLEDEGLKKMLTEFAAQMCRGLGQDTIFLGWGDESYIIKRDFEYGDVPVLRFTELPQASQIVHLTLGWAGISSPDKILQVLSLDGWTLPDASDTARHLWKICGVLHEGLDRRAWAWMGDAAGLKAALRESEKGGPQSGDLIFSHGRPNLLDFGLVKKNGLVGPRDLRLSHGQLNPVTRHLLFRLLRREWDALQIDLRRKPLDQRFFPKLQGLRAAVESEFIERIAGTNQKKTAQDATVPASPTKKRRKKAKPSPAEQQAFRESVLVVGRMMFLRFLIQKGWIPGGLEKLQAKSQLLGDAFYSKWITPLWFDVLNVPESDRDSAVVGQFGDGYPYLNGGLFMPRPGERHNDLPAALFAESSDVSFLRLFEDFEFSLNEHDGSDDSLKVDPSFFGRALESFNPDVEKKRHGVHYTPKPIARALAAEAIATRVAALADLPVASVQDLLRGRRTITGRQASQVRDILAGLRIIDPAVGSGVLLWAALRVLLDLDSACDAVVGGRDGYQPGSYEWAVRSRHFVCNCLYGVDISDEAVELSRLRLWLAVALSEDTPAPLPDLELNICRGDSLLGEQPRRGGVSQMKLGYDESGKLEHELRLKTSAYVEAGTQKPLEQRRLRGEIHEIRKRLLNLDHDPGAEPQLNWNLFFPHVFGDAAKHGFDVVIANPPYVRVQQVDKGLLPAYRDKWPTIASGNADLSYAFIELALKKLAAPEGGQIAFIQPNFRHHDAARSVRRLLTGGDATTPVHLRLWVDFDDAQVFPTAANYVALLFAERATAQRVKQSFTYSVPRQDSWEDPDDSTDIRWLRPENRTHENPTNGEWLTVEWELRSRVIAHAAEAQVRLRDIANVDVGIQTSADQIYLFESGKTREDGTVDVLAQGNGKQVRLEAGILRRCVKGAAGADYWLLFPYDHQGKLMAESQLAERYPLAMVYLADHRRTLEQREDGAFKGDRWYQYGRSQGCVACCKPKIIVPSALDRPVTFVDRAGELAFTASGKGGGGAWAITLKNGGTTSFDELAAALTGDRVWDFFRTYGSPQKGGWKGVDKGVLEALPIASGR